MHLFKKQIQKWQGLYNIAVEIKYFLTYYQHKRWLEKSPEHLIQKIFYKYFKKKINLKNPNTFNEKLQWLKLYWFDERATICSDKYRVREFVEKKGLGFTLTELCGPGVIEDPDNINLDDLPNRFVLKPTHDSGHTIICTDKNTINWNKIKRQLKRWLTVDYSLMSGEWPYRGVERKILCEKLLEDKTNGELFDYKLFCFNGHPEMVFFVSDRRNHAKSDFYDLEWNKLPFRWLYEPSGEIFPRPSKLNEMIEYATILAEGFPFVRIDFYEVNGKVYFGEMTFFHGGGLGWFEPEEIDFKLGEKLILPDKNNAWEKYR